MRGSSEQQTIRNLRLITAAAGDNAVVPQRHLPRPGCYTSTSTSRPASASRPPCHRRPLDRGPPAAATGGRLGGPSTVLLLAARRLLRSLGLRLRLLHGRGRRLRTLLAGHVGTPSRLTTLPGAPYRGKPACVVGGFLLGGWRGHSNLLETVQARPRGTRLIAPTRGNRFRRRVAPAPPEQSSTRRRVHEIKAP
jgi:hypothetical protein